MDYLLSGSGGTENLSLQDMIECDIKSEFGDLSSVSNYESSTVLGQLGVDLSSDLLNHNESMDILPGPGETVSDIDTFSAPDKISEPIVSKPDNSMSWLQTVNLSNISTDVLNNDSNVTEVLMVNPQTGIPVQLQTATTTQDNTPSRVQFVTATLPRGTTIQQALQGLQQQQQQQQAAGNTTNIQTISNAQLITQALTSGNCATLSSVSIPSQTQVQQATAPSVVTQQLLSSNNNQLKKTKNFDSITSKVFPKPVYSYSCLIAMALKNSETGALPVSEIYSFMTENFPYFNTAPDGWKNSVRHNLSLNKCFEKIENPKATGNTRKGCLWGLNPAKVEKMDEEIAKWRKKDLEAIQRSMAKPEVLEILEKGNIGSHSPHHPNNIRTAQQSYSNQTQSITPAVVTSNQGVTSLATTAASAPVPAASKPIVGDIQLSMIEIKPAEHSMLQTPVKIKVEPIVIKPELIDPSGAVGVPLSSEDLNLLDTSLSLDPSLDLALQNGLWEELGADGGISLDDIALTSLGQGGFSNSSSPLTVQSNKTGSSSGSATSPLVSLLTSTVGSNAKGAAGSHTVTPSGGLAISRTIFAQM